MTEVADIKLDGRLDEAVWRRIPAYDHMMVTTPDNDEPAAYRTHTFLFYSERGLYVGAWNEQPPGHLGQPADWSRCVRHLRRLPDRHRQFGQRPLRLLVPRQARRLVDGRHAAAGAAVHEQLGRTVARQDVQDRRRLDGRDVPALGDAEHAGDDERRWRAAHGGRVRAFPCAPERSLVVAGIAVDGAAVHLVVPADRAQGRRAQAGGEPVPVRRRRAGHRPRRRQQQGGTRCLLATFVGVLLKCRGQSRFRPGGGRQRGGEPVRLRDVFPGKAPVLPGEPGRVQHRRLRLRHLDHDAAYAPLRDRGGFAPGRAGPWGRCAVQGRPDRETGRSSARHQGGGAAGPVPVRPAGRRGG